MSQPAKKRFVVVGASHRAMSLFIKPLIKTYQEAAEISALVDIDVERIGLMNQMLKTSMPGYHADDFEKVLEEQKPDAVLVATPDAMHHTYVIKALEKDIEVYCEKPVTTDEAKCRAILAAEKKSKANVTVTFNCRYTQLSTQIRELMQQGSVGKAVSVEFSEYLDTYHGASYFMRWNRKRSISGGLSVHKCTHYFDVVNWWIDQKPVEVFAYGARNFYGPDGPYNPSRKDGRVCPLCEERAECPYYMQWHRSEWRGENAKEDLDEHVSGLQKLSHYKSHDARRCIYDSEIDIEDTFSAVVKYDGGASLAFTFHASAPYEGYRVGINGINGRLEAQHFAVRGSHQPAQTSLPPITVWPMFGGRQEVYPPPATGGHGGADPLLMDELVLGTDPGVSVQRQAPLMDGILSVLTGVAVNKSIAEGKPIRIADLLRA